MFSVMQEGVPNHSPSMAVPTPGLPRLTADEVARYSRHLSLPEMGETGQQRLKAARVAVVGPGVARGIAVLAAGCWRWTRRCRAIRPSTGYGPRRRCTSETDAAPHSAGFVTRWFEFDGGWLYIRLLSAFGMAQVGYARGRWDGQGGRTS